MTASGLFFDKWNLKFNWSMNYSMWTYKTRYWISTPQLIKKSEENKSRWLKRSSLLSSFISHELSLVLSKYYSISLLPQFFLKWSHWKDEGYCLPRVFPSNSSLLLMIGLSALCLLLEIRGLVHSLCKVWWYLSNIQLRRWWLRCLRA